MFRSLFSLLISATCLGSCASAQDNSSQKIPPKQFQLTMDSLKESGTEFYLIDVRTPEEFQAGHIGDAMLINWFDAGFKTAIEQLDPEKPVMLYCKSGGRSGKASRVLLEYDFKQIYDLSSGFTGWRQAGLPEN